MLLKLLLSELSKTTIKTTIFLGHKKVIDDIKKEAYFNVKIIETNTKETLIRYAKKRENIVFLCNLPPFVKNKDSHLIFYNELFFKKKNILKRSGIKFYIYNIWFRLFNKNIDKVLVQSKHLERIIKEQTNCKHVENIPIYKKVNKRLNVKKEHDFCYVSSAPPHKNHLRLFNALEILLKKNIQTSIIVTIFQSENTNQLLERIAEINLKYPNAIKNVGYIDNSEIEEIYCKSKALVFPSISEAFGLPLIEAHDLGLKVLTSDLPYTFDIFQEVITFNPFEEKDLAEKMENFINGKYENSKQIAIITNQLDNYVKTLTS